MIAEPASESHIGRGPERADSTLGRGDPVPESLVCFAAGIAHDFNNLLTVINGYSELILEGGAGPEGYRYYARSILEAGRKAAEIVELILAYAGMPAFSSEIFDLNRVLEEMRAPLACYLGESITLTLRICREPAPVKGECGRFQWAVANLAMNAKDAMPEGGHLDLVTRLLPDGEAGGFSLDARSPRWELSMRDTGCGMAKEDLPRVFHPYFSTKKKSNEHGTGLGLASVQGIVRQLGGCILAESEPGQGSVFRICLPLADAGRK